LAGWLGNSVEKLACLAEAEASLVLPVASVELALAFAAEILKEAEADRVLAAVLLQ